MRAAALQAESQHRGEPEHTSLSELKRIAAEAGIDEAFVDRALAEEEGLGAKSGDRFLFGAPVRSEIVRTIPGPLTDTVWEEIVAECHSSLGFVGTLHQAGSIREWKAIGGQTINVSARSRGDTTIVSIQTDNSAGLVLPYFITFMFALVATGGVGDTLSRQGVATWAILAGALSTLAVIMLVLRTIIQSWHRRNSAKLERLADRLEKVGSLAASTDAATNVRADDPRSLLQRQTPAPGTANAPQAEEKLSRE